MFSEQEYQAQLKARGIQSGNMGATGGVSLTVSGKPIPTKTEFIKPSGLPGVVQKAADVASQTLDIGRAVGEKTLKFVGNTAVDIARQGMSTLRTIRDAGIQPIQNKEHLDQSKKISEKEQAVITAYGSGKMSKDDYIKSLQDISKSYTDISKEAQKISGGMSPNQRAWDVANTAVNVLTFGSFTTEKALGKEAATGIIGKMENVITKVPAIKSLVERNATSIIKAGAAESFDEILATQSKQLAIGLLIKRPIFYQSNISGGKDVYEKIIAGDYTGAAKSSAWLATQMLEGGPIGAFLKGASWIKTGTSKLAYGKGSFIDEISKQIGNKNPNQIAKFLSTVEKKAPQEFEEANKVFKVLQETNLRAVNEDVQTAVDNVLTHYHQNNISLDNLTPSQLYKDFSNWAKADELAQRTLRSGLIKDISPEDASKYVVVRLDSATKNAIAETVAKAGNNKQAQIAALYEMAQRPGVGWGNNEILMKKLESAILDGYDLTDITKAIRSIPTVSTLAEGVPKKVAQELADLGFSIAAPFGGRKTPIVDTNDLRKLVTGAIEGNPEVFDTTNAPQPELAAIAGALNKMGLSPQSSNKVANRKLQESVVATLDNLGMGGEMGLKNTQGGDIVNGGQAILSKLQSYVENKRPALGLGKNSALTDIRQLRIGEIQEALGVTKSQAKAISNAVMDGYTKVPLEFRGLGDKIVDELYKYNPLQKYYARIQSAFRYTYNPFFRVQESVETKLLSHAQANNLVWGKSRRTLDDAAKLLDQSGMFTSSLPGEAAGDQVLGRITANITQGQKRDLAGLALDLANSRGLTLEKMVAEHSDEIDDALRVVVQYPTKGILASPLARTLNLAFFPIRYNTKVTLLAAQALAKQPPSVQLAVTHSIFQMKDWLKSDEGIRWQAAHSDAIQLFKWLTPVNSIQATFNTLGHKPDSVSDLGQLGGLPLGVITQILDGQGIIRLNTPYVNPKTGDVFPDNIPQTMKARAATALTDLLGTTFTYPGRILGLPGKEATMKKFVATFIATNGKDFDKNIDMERLTPLQKNWVRVLKGDTSTEAIDSLYNSPNTGGYQGYTIPPLSLPYKVVPPTTQAKPLQKRTGLPAKSTSKKSKTLAIPIQ